MNRTISGGGIGLVVGLGLLCLTLSVNAQGTSGTPSASDGIAKYREMIADGNPAELYEAEGEAL